MLVRNAKNTSGNRCNCCDSWIAHWANNSRTEALKCSVAGCKETSGIIGGHVVKVGVTDIDQYIVPLCQSHNKVDDKDLEIGSTVLITAHSSNYCRTVFKHL